MEDSNPSQFGFSGRSAALARQQDDTQDRQLTTVVLLQKAETTSDYMRSLFFTGFSVDSPLGSFSPVLPAPGAVIFLVRKVLPGLGVFDDHPLHFFMLVWSPL